MAPRPSTFRKALSDENGLPTTFARSRYGKKRFPSRRSEKIASTRLGRSIEIRGHPSLRQVRKVTKTPTQMRISRSKGTWKGSICACSIPASLHPLRAIERSLRHIRHGIQQVAQRPLSRTRSRSHATAPSAYDDRHKRPKHPPPNCLFIASHPQKGSRARRFPTLAAMPSSPKGRTMASLRAQGAKHAA